VGTGGGSFEDSVQDLEPVISGDGYVDEFALFEFGCLHGGVLEKL